ncbi:MAG: phosphoribosylanthranilate isomerase [Opitutaceae bacterium]|jgi:phosphoribosylanthranilate isomerase
MINGIQLKVCGITSVKDAVAAARIGADFIGFIFYPKSPRALTFESYQAMSVDLPNAPQRVAVMVEPSAEELAAAVVAGFDFFQIHFTHTTPLATVQGWSLQVGAHRLWLAPKLPPTEDVPTDWLPLAGAFLMDTFHASGFGGSGQTGDWGKFARHHLAYPQNKWILAGGLNPDNVGDAVARSGAHFVDVNSGVEAKPRVKDPVKLQHFVEALAGRV